MHVGQGAPQVCGHCMQCSCGLPAVLCCAVLGVCVPVRFECGVSLQVLLNALPVIRIALLQAAGEQRARFR